MMTAPNDRQPRPNYAGQERKKLLRAADEQLQSEMARMQVHMENAKAARADRLAEPEPEPEPCLTVRTHAEIFLTACAR